VRILLIEDSDSDACLIGEMLSLEAGEFELVRADRLVEGMHLASAQQFDVLLLDMSLPDSHGYQTFLSAREKAPELPIVIFSALNDNGMALKAVAAGAQDYLPKERLTADLLCRSIRYAIERRRAAVAVRESENQYRVLFDSLPIAAYTCDARGQITYFNAKAVEIWGRSPALRDDADRFTGAYKLFSTDGSPLPKDQSWLAKSLRTGESYVAKEVVVERPDGHRGVMLTNVNLVRSADGRVSGAVNLLVDITERRRAEEALRQKTEMLQAIFDNIPMMIACFADGKPGFVNREWERFHKMSIADIPLRDVIAELYPDPADRKRAQDFIEAKDGTWLDFRPRLPDGTIGDTSWMIVPLSDGMCVHLGQDISERKNAERQIREKERFARATVDALSASIAILDETGTILEVNDAWRRSAKQHGLAPQSWGDFNYLEVCDRARGIDAESAAEAAAGIRAVLNGDFADFCLDYPCRKKWFAMRVTRFPGDGPMRVVVAHEDITERKRAEALEVERGMLRSAIKAMDQVLGVVGHELRSPLAGLRAMSEFLSEPDARGMPEFDQFLRAIGSEVVRMSDIVDNLLEAARLNSGRARWNWESFDPMRVCEDAVESTRPLFDENQVRLTCKTGAPGTEVRGDPSALRRLIINLVSNARKHTRIGEIEVALQFHPLADGNWVELTVRDTGAGIDPAIVSRLGEAFALNSGVVGANFVSGTGLGLAICKGIAAAHGGAITIASEQGQGTTVTVMMRADLPEPITSPTETSIGHPDNARYLVQSET
jgi:PAS domain S-box-containing protein